MKKSHHHVTRSYKYLKIRESTFVVDHYFFLFVADNLFHFDSRRNKDPNYNILSCRAYTSIVTLDQRQRYKADFNKSYAHYRKLHNVLDEVSRRFAHLENKLKQTTRSSEESKVRRITGTFFNAMGP